MREILFRGKTRTTEGKKWVYGYLYKVKSFFSEDYQYFIKNTHLQEFSVDEETIGQYTGLKDKNGKEIYEGDILRYEGGGIYRVVFDEMMIMCPQDNIEMPSPGYYGILIGDKTKELCPLGVTQRLAKVIGNIHDNPELLGSEDKYD